MKTPEDFAASETYPEISCNSYANQAEYFETAFRIKIIIRHRKLPSDAQSTNHFHAVSI